MAAPGGPQIPGPSLRIRVGDSLVYTANICLVSGSNSSITLRSRARAIYDDGTEDTFVWNDKTYAGVASGGTVSGAQFGDHTASKNGYIVEWTFYGPPGTGPPNSVWVQGYIAADPANATNWACVLKGIIEGQESLVGIGEFVPFSPDLWPLWCFQGTVQEDATVGTHVCTLTISPGAGGAMEIVAAEIIATGAGGPVENAYITDGTNILAYLFQATAAGTYTVPAAIAAAAGLSAGGRIRLSGAMQLVLTASTSTVSDTQTFSVIARIMPTTIPTATLADNTGSPTVTTNTNKVF